MASKSLKQRVPPSPPRVTQELAALESELGGRRELVGLLTLAPLTADLKYTLGLLGDPRHDAKSLADLCAYGNILPGDLLKHLSAAALLRGKVKAAQHIGDGIGAVAKDVMQRAAPYDAPCYTCQGSGTVTPEPTKQVPNPEPEPCQTCRATGVLHYQPELERQKLAVDLAGLLPKGQGVQILNQQIAGGGDPSRTTFATLQTLTDEILYGPDATVEDGESDPPADAPDGPARGEDAPPTDP